MKNYFAILELTADATDDEVRRAYRRLVKIYHPDAGGSQEDHLRFVEITEAYDYLVDPARRRRHAAYHKQKLTTVYTAQRSKVEYEEWLRREQMMAWVRMRKKQKQEEEEAFRNSTMYKVLKWANKIYNVIFLFICAGIVSLPLYRYFNQDDLSPDQRQHFVVFLIPVLIGLGFAMFGYYYFFILKTDEK